MTIPLCPNGEEFDINVKSMTEMVFEPRSQYFAITLMGEHERRKMRLEVNVYDYSIQVSVMVDGHCSNHSFNNNLFADRDARNGWWEMKQ